MASQGAPDQDRAPRVLGVPGFAGHEKNEFGGDAGDEGDDSPEAAALRNKRTTERNQRIGFVDGELYNTPDIGGTTLSTNTAAGVDWDPGGGGEAVVDGYKVGGTSAWDKDVADFRNKGAAAQGRNAVALDQSTANQSRVHQMGALGMLRRQADGSAPSAAAILSQRANQSAAQQIGAAGLRKGGPGAAIAGMNAASPAAGNAALAANAQNAGVRAGEISRGQSGFAGGAVGVQGQDINAATTNAQLVAKQRAMNEAKQQGMERLGFDTRTTQLQAGQDAERNAHLRQLSINLAGDAKRDGESQAEALAVGTAAQAGSSALQAGSDPRTKQNVRPLVMGSLSGLRR